MNNSLKKFGIISLVVFLLCLGLESINSADPAGHISLRSGFGARSAVLGGPNPATGDAESLYWNPAGLAVNGAGQIFASHFFWLDSIAMDQVGLMLTAPWQGNFGIGATLLSVPPFNSTADSSMPRGEGREGAVWLAGGLRLNSFLDIGVSTKFVFSQWMGASSLGGAMDLGLVYRPPWPCFQVQASWLNLGLATPLEEQADPLPTTFHSAVMYQIPLSGAIRPRLTAAVSFDQDMKARGAIGSEIELFRQVILRGGYHIQPDMIGKWSTGLGVSFSPFHLDYTMMTLPELGMVHMAGLKYSFFENQGRPQVQVRVFGRKNEKDRFEQQFDIQTKAAGPIRKWRLKIYNAKQQLLKLWQGTNEPPQKLVWDMKNTRGHAITAEEGNQYSCWIEDEVFRTAEVKGRLLSQQTVLAPKLRPLPSAPGKAIETLLAFSFQQVQINFQPRAYKLEFTTNDGKIVKEFSQIVKEPQDIILPANITNYKLTVIGKQGEKQVISAPVVTVKTGPLIALDDLLLGIPMPLKFENPEAQLHSWKLDVRDTKRNVKLKTYQGSGQPPGQLEWTPEKPDLPAKPVTRYHAHLYIRDQHGISWEQQIPFNIVSVHDKSTNQTETKLEVGQIYFSYNKYFIKQAMFRKLKAAAMIIRQYNNTRVLIKGHTDERGGDKYNKKLSRSRAMAVKRYLVEDEGLDEKIFTIKGYGYHVPYSKGRRDQDRRKNRRVEVLISFPEPK
ncbi:OmpA family protein [bacterium]|nr:OmpA family protein [bacterium]